MITDHADLTFRPETVLGLSGSVHKPGRIHKKTLIGQAAAVASDAALITRVVTVASVEAVLSADNMKIPAYVADDRRVEDIAVLRVALSDKASAGDRRRIEELLHRCMPRPLILFLNSPREGQLLSLALTHVNLNDPDRATSVIDRNLVLPLSHIRRGTLRLERLNRSDLWTLYRDLVRVAAADGLPASASLSTEDALNLRGRLLSLRGELSLIARDAKREKSQARRISLNTTARDLRHQIDTLARSLYASAPPTEIYSFLAESTRRQNQ